MENHFLNEKSTAVKLLFGQEYFDDYNEIIYLNGLIKH